MAAHEGNKYALGNNGGRPPIFKDSEELEKKIVEYFDYILGEIDENDKVIKPPENPTVTGLTLFLGFASKQSLYDYIKKEEFSYSIKRALSIVENHYEQSLNTKAAGGAIFALKNMNWKDKSEIGHTISDSQKKAADLFPDTDEITEED